MKLAVKADRSYGLTYKKKTIPTDPYLPRGRRGKVLVCGGCHAVHMNKRWYADNGLAESIGRTKETVPAACPACQKMRANFPGGIVTHRGGYVLPHKQDILNLVKNEEGRARGFNPLERFAYIAPPFAVIFTAGLLWRRANGAAALATLGAGFSFTLFLQFYLFRQPWLAPYANYLHRAETFVAAVRALAGERG